MYMYPRVCRLYKAQALASHGTSSQVREERLSKGLFRTVVAIARAPESRKQLEST